MEQTPQTFRAVDSNGMVFDVQLLKTIGSGGAYARAPVASSGTQPARPVAKQTGTR